MKTPSLNLQTKKKSNWYPIFNLVQYYPPKKKLTKIFILDDGKLLFQPIEPLTQESGRCQPFLFSIFDPRLIFTG